MDIDGPVVAELVADVGSALSRRAAVVSEDVYEVVLREIPELRDDKPVLALLYSSVQSNVGTCLQILQHQIDLSAVQAPAAALEYARRRAQRGTPPLTALLRAYRLGHACFSDWLFKELARHSDDAQMITAATLGMSKIVAGYVDQTSEEIVAAYTGERERWLRNRSAARAARIRDPLSGERIDVSATEATLGYRLRQYHVGLVCWAGDATAAVDNITRLEHAISQVAEQAACSASPAFLPRDESSAWAWLPLGIRDTFDAAGARTAGADGDIHFAFGNAVQGVTGFRLTHRQAIAAQAVALAAGSPSPRVVTFREVAPVAMMLGSADLLRAWVLATLGGLATDDENHARLRDTLLVFLQSGGSYKATADQLVLHKNTVQYRIRKAEESLAGPPPRTATTWNSRCGPAAGSARPCCSRPGNDQQPRRASARPGSRQRGRLWRRNGSPPRRMSGSRCGPNWTRSGGARAETARLNQGFTVVTGAAFQMRSFSLRRSMKPRTY